MEYYLSALKKYAVFNGRARRAEYWYFLLFNMIITFSLDLIGEGFSGLAFGTDGTTLGSIYYLAIIIPSLAVSVRRMHDVDKSGWFILIPIYNLILALTEGTKGNNAYGPDPKTTAAK